MKLNGNFLGGQGMQNKKPSMGRVWIFHILLGAAVLSLFICFSCGGDLPHRKKSFFFCLSSVGGRGGGILPPSITSQI